MRRIPVVWCVAALAVPAPAWSGTPVTVCFRNEILVSPSVLAYTMFSLKRFESPFGIQIRFGCNDPGAVQVTFREDPPPSAVAGALGATRAQNGRLLPEIEVYRRPVLRLFPEADPFIEGRAMGTVAAHELGHFLRQKPGHDSQGIMAPQLSARHLLHGFR